MPTPVAAKSPFGPGPLLKERGNPAQRMKALDHPLRAEVRKMERKIFGGAPLRPDFFPSNRELLDLPDQRVQEPPMAEYMRMQRAANAVVDAFVTGHLGAPADEHPAAEAVRAFMEAAGWEEAGYGHFSIVFVKGGFAIKVSLKPEDSGAAYAAWARENRGAVGVPTIYSIDRGARGYTVLMPEYIPVSSTFEHGAVIRALRDVAYGKPAENALEGTMLRIRRFFMGVAKLDIHQGNVMMDREGNLIITDPVSFRNET